MNKKIHKLSHFPKHFFPNMWNCPLHTNEETVLFLVPYFRLTIISLVPLLEKKNRCLQNDIVKKVAIRIKDLFHEKPVSKTRAPYSIAKWIPNGGSRLNGQPFSLSSKAGIILILNNTRQVVTLVSSSYIVPPVSAVVPEPQSC